MNASGFKPIRWLVALFVAGPLACFCLRAYAHDVITTKLTWDGEISRIFYARCASCHHTGGTAFSLITYQQTQPWAKAIEAEVLERRMPPWGAVKGFGEFRNDQALSQEQLSLIADWVDGGAPEGDPNDLPAPPGLAAPPAAPRPARQLLIGGDYKLPIPYRLDGLRPLAVPERASIQITVEFPDGRVEPLVWLRDYKAEFAHDFLLRTPLDLPPGSIIRGVPPGSSVALLPAGPPPAPEHPAARDSARN